MLHDPNNLGTSVDVTVNVDQLKLKETAISSTDDEKAITSSSANATVGDMSPSVVNENDDNSQSIKSSQQSPSPRGSKVTSSDMIQTGESEPLAVILINALFHLLFLPVCIYI